MLSLTMSFQTSQQTFLHSFSWDNAIVVSIIGGHQLRSEGTFAQPMHFDLHPLPFNQLVFLLLPYLLLGQILFKMSEFGRAINYWFERYLFN